jgi:hypothetical protein
MVNFITLEVITLWAVRQRNEGVFKKLAHVMSGRAFFDYINPTSS